MKEAIKRLLRQVTYRLGYQNLDHLSLLLSSRLNKRREFFIVQIGANDGTTYDPIHDFIVANRGKVRGIMLEPLPDFCEQLRATYRDFPGIRILQRAIHATEKTMMLHRVDPSRLDGMPSFVRGIASFDPAYHVKSGTPPEAIVTEQVECMTMDELLTSCDVHQIDLLCIDTEGYDSEILLSVDFEKVRPAIIFFEHGLRDHVMSDEAFVKVVSLLNRYEYDVMVQDYDAIAHLRHRLAT